jgi:hypothetical protein
MRRQHCLAPPCSFRRSRAATLRLDVYSMRLWDASIWDNGKFGWGLWYVHGTTQDEPFDKPVAECTSHPASVPAAPAPPSPARLAVGGCRRPTVCSRGNAQPRCAGLAPLVITLTLPQARRPAHAHASLLSHVLYLAFSAGSVPGVN